MTERREVLLIDENALRRADFAALLLRSGLNFELTLAANAEAALCSARARPFDGVLLAIGRLNAQIANLIRRLTSAEGGCQAVIVVSEDAGLADGQTMLSIGAADWLVRQDATAAALARAITFAQARRGYVETLRQAREEAEANAQVLARDNRKKAMILAFVAHDLRNPFQTMLSASGVIAASARGDASLARCAAGLHEGTRRAHGLLESLFSWASLSRNAGNATPSPVAADALLRECVDGGRERAQAKHIRVEAKLSGLSVLTHETAAATILRNLLDNALKFTPAGGAITLSAERRGSSIALTVADTGLGMTEALAASLFRPDRRTGSPGTEGERSGGLGLILCRDLAEWIDGGLEVESQPGAGSTFRLLLPEAPAQPLAASQWPTSRAKAPAMPLTASSSVA